MSISFSRDSFSQITPPSLTLIKASGERIGVIPVTEFTYTENFNDLDVINFSTKYMINGEANPVYDEISNMKYIEVGNNEAVFCITTVHTTSESTHQETKTVEAKSLEVLLGQLYEYCVFNTGDEERGSIDGVKFYNPADTSHSLMHLVLAKATGWEMGHIDDGLASMQRSFDQDRISIYDFLMNDISEAFDVHLTFDTHNKEINAYHLDTYGEDTNIHVSYNNLLKSSDMECNTDDIKTCITLMGQDDLTVREVNLGSSELYNFDFFSTEEYWSAGLVAAYNAWKAKYNQNLPQYNALLAQYEQYVETILNKQTNMFPETDNWDQWVNMTKAQAQTYMRQYSYDHLYEKKQAYEQKQTVMQKSGWGESGNANYSTKYLPVYNVIQWIQEILTAKQTDINRDKATQAGIMSQMEAIMNVVAMPNNFTQAQLEELSMFIREEELTSDNYLVTDAMTTEERYGMLEDMLAYGQKELLRVSTPQLSFSSSIVNLYNIPEFDTYSGDFQCGNYIWVTLRDDYNIKAKLLSITVDYFDPANFECIFGNIVRKEKNVFTDIQDAMNAATSAATSVSFNSSYWSEGSKTAGAIDIALEEGLTRAGYVLTDGTGTDAVWDERGLFLNTQATRADGTADPHPNDSIFLGGGRILFTADKWKTVETALGRIAKYTQNSSGTNAGKVTITPDATFGLLAKQVVAGQIYGSEFIGGSVKSSNYISQTGNYCQQGTFLDLTSGEIRTPQFSVVGGVAHFGGSGSEIQANTINGSSIKNGTIIGTKIKDGEISTEKIADGAVTETQIAGGAITTDKIKACAITANLITANAINATHIVANAITADKISANAITAAKIQASAVTADKISANAVTAAKIQASAVTADKISANAVTAAKISANAVNATHIVANAITAGKISANAVNANHIVANAITAGKISANAVNANHIVANAITAGKISANAVNSSHIVANAITAGKISANAVNANHIVANAITAGKISANAVNANHIVANTITTGKLATNAIKSLNYNGSGTEYFAASGTYLDLADGVIHSKNFRIDNNGNAYFRGDISGASGTFSGIITSIGSNGTITTIDGGYIEMESKGSGEKYMTLYETDEIGRRWKLQIGGNRVAIQLDNGERYRNIRWVDFINYVADRID